MTGLDMFLSDVSREEKRTVSPIRVIISSLRQRLVFYWSLSGTRSIASLPFDTGHIFSALNDNLETENQTETDRKISDLRSSPPFLRSGALSAWVLSNTLSLFPRLRRSILTVYDTSISTSWRSMVDVWHWLRIGSLSSYLCSTQLASRSGLHLSQSPFRWSSGSSYSNLLPLISDLPKHTMALTRGSST
ncbi:uncharacterized protein BDR25DRAFT_356678 [Lindgomyces ingoldianus]|uniref:Uncharacterized protein n=1 Tax=Lindgomyces ingoldianus TaxID=673940 RepID=A0ACB6QRB9_9PLEO|nr:uncharacterized protein BDR25DRAFT_356678 [Lindgomyces ingoldianus]KAF2469451.1 hypothetical protein BDR25DRAFT_356678 [Lindgomyces ingoldianus]